MFVDIILKKSRKYQNAYGVYRIRRSKIKYNIKSSVIRDMFTRLKLGHSTKFSLFNYDNLKERS